MLVGYSVDPEIFVWSLAWWPHAILHGENPFVTHAIWAPEGVNLAWTTSIPGLALLAAPVTLALGPALAYNLLAVCLPALAAWTAYRLCRHLTGSAWASLAGGYLFGFSPYVLGQSEGHVHMTAVFLVPLVALVLVRALEGTSSRRATAALLGVLTGAQLWFSTELALTLALAVSLSLAAGLAVAPAHRGRIVRLLPAVAGGWALGALLAAPLLAEALLHFQRAPINAPASFPADLLNLVVPTHLTWASWGWTDRVAAAFRGNDAENGAYLGLPTLAIVVLFFRERWGTARARFLATVLPLGLLVELGTALHVRGRSVVPLPWRAVSALPVLDDVLPVRFSMFVSLAAAVTVASWAAASGAPRRLRAALPALAALAVVPSLWNPVWHETPRRPAFFADRTYRSCLEPGENVVVLPLPRWSDAMLWQAESGFAFRMAEGYVSPPVPAGIPERVYLTRLEDTNMPGRDWRPLVRFARAQGATAILVEGGHGSTWTDLLAPVATPLDVGGVFLYRLGQRGGPACAPGATGAS
jgi:hypothetical protein